MQTEIIHGCEHENSNACSEQILLLKVNGNFIYLDTLYELILKKVFAMYFSIYFMVEQN